MLRSISTGYDFFFRCVSILNLYQNWKKLNDYRFYQSHWFYTIIIKKWNLYLEKHKKVFKDKFDFQNVRLIKEHWEININTHFQFPIQRHLCRIFYLKYAGFLLRFFCPFIWKPGDLLKQNDLFSRWMNNVNTYREWVNKSG